jgi:hypothetical protein
LIGKGLESNKILRFLAMGNNPIGDKGAENLSKGILSTSGLTAVNLDTCQITGNCALG